MTGEPRSPEPRPARGAALGLAAAALFGVSAPLAKVLLGEISPVLLAGFLYLGAAIGLFCHRALRPSTKEAPLRRENIPMLAGVVLAGGTLGPVLMLLGLQRVTAFTGSLLLNLEAPFTVILAVVFFREHLGRYAALAALFIFSGALALRLEPGTAGADTRGVLLLAGACLCWALDNNLTQRLTERDPLAIVRVKTLGAGTVNTALGLALEHARFPGFAYVAGALVLGALSYGLSVVLDAYALRLVGAAREAAYFATAPFVGALTSVALLRDPLRWYDVGAMGSMALGIALLVREKHRHLHRHEPLEHEHLHEHDEHHRHDHGPGAPTGEPHSHLHRHEPLEHEHPHLPDAHHRHKH
jgi:drug/metabolite transporter (DMT)-like permease